LANALGWVSRCDLKVVRMRGWRREMLWSDTGLPWVQLSPNIPREDSPAYYVATGMIGELGGIEGGCGGPTPFEVFAARGLDSDLFTAAMRALRLPGIGFSPFGDKGTRLKIDPRTSSSLTALNVYFLAAVHRVTPRVFARCKGDRLDMFYKAYGSTDIRAQVERGVPPSRIVAGWDRTVASFKALRQPYLLY
jgi:uncharacterized protein YbbC (DUF1343 family)